MLRGKQDQCYVFSGNRDTQHTYSTSSGKNLQRQEIICNKYEKDVNLFLFWLFDICIWFILSLDVQVNEAFTVSF